VLPADVDGTVAVATVAGFADRVAGVVAVLDFGDRYLDIGPLGQRVAT